MRISFVSIYAGETDSLDCILDSYLAFECWIRCNLGKRTKDTQQNNYIESFTVLLEQRRPL